MFIRDLAKRIPDEIRSQRIMTKDDPINNAISVVSNYQMILLAEIWYEFVDVNADKGYCSVCLQNILRNYKEMYPILVQLENEYILNQL